MKKIIISLLFVLNFLTLYSQDIPIEFQRDTARVEQKVRDMLDKDDTTAGMMRSNYVLEEEYDKLLNKYYKLLYNKLNDKGKKTLKEAQRNWIKLRDADKNLIAELRSNTYEQMGGGTIWGVIATYEMALATRERFFVLYRYLMFDNLYE